MRGHPRDYDNWSDMGNTGWSYPEVLPYFKKSEDNRQIGSLVDEKYHSRGGYLTTQQFPDAPELAHDILKAAEEVGFGSSNDLNGDKITGFAIAQTHNRFVFFSLIIDIIITQIRTITVKFKDIVY